MNNNNNNIESCPISKALAVLGGKWRLFIIHQIGLEIRRFGELKRLIPSISEKMLIQELKNLAAAGIVHRQAYKEIPPKVEYSLTDFGKKALPIVGQIRFFGEQLSEAQVKK